MEKIVFESYASLAEHMMNVAEKGDTAYAVCFLDDAVEVMRELLKYDGTNIGGINIAQEDYNGYSKEYFISVDGDMLIDVEPAWQKANEYHEAGYLWFDAEKIFIVGDANSSILKCVDLDKCCEIEFDIPKDEVDLVEEILEKARIELDSDGIPVGISIDIMSLIDIFCGE